MKALAIIQLSHDFHKQHQEVIQTPVLQNEFPVTDVLQRESACPCGGGCPLCEGDMVIQPKLRIGESGDRYERVADEVMRMPEHEVQRSPGQPLNPKTRAFMESHFGYDLRRIQIHNAAPTTIQTKLTIGQPNDRYEREADWISDQVMATPEHTEVSGAPPHIQRFSGQSNGQMVSAPASVDQALSSYGRPLEPALRQDMEQRFGHNFSQVRVHSGATAEQSAREVNANAYTVGHNMVFNAGRFAPETHEGRRLLAHELTHVVQQDCGSPRAVHREIHSPEERVEMLPEQLHSAERATRGEAEDLPQTPSASVPMSSRRICGPDVGNEIRRVWCQVQDEFRVWLLPAKRNACLYLIQLFTPQTSRGVYGPPGSTLPVALNKNGFDTLGLFQEGAGWQRSSPYFPCCGVPGTAARNPLDDYDPGHEDVGRCSNTVTVGGQCWLMGTVNYGAFGLMMKLCHDLLPASEGAVIGEQMFASIERYIDQIQRSGQTIGQDVSTVVQLVVGELLRQLGIYLPEARVVVEEIVQYVINNPALVQQQGTEGAAGRVARNLVDAAITMLLRRGVLRRSGAAIGGQLGPAQLFSRSSVTTFVTGFKIFDADDPGPPLRWALATYDSGPGATPSGGNRANCGTTCPLTYGGTYGGTPFDYVWEPTKPRRNWSSTSPNMPCPTPGP